MSLRGSLVCKHVEPGLKGAMLLPTTAMVSLRNLMANSATTKAAGVGYEGEVDVSLFMGGDATSSSAFVQTAGDACRRVRHTLVQEFNRALTALF